MEKISMSTFNAIEKLTNIYYFFFLLSLILFTNLYLNIGYQTTIRQITEDWIRIHSTFHEILLFIVCVGCFYALVVPLAWAFAAEIIRQHIILITGIRGALINFSIRYPYNRFSKFCDVLLMINSSFDLSDWVHVNTLRNFAIQSNNSMAHKECEMYFERKHRSNDLQKIIFSIVGLLTVHKWYFPLAFDQINIFPPSLSILFWGLVLVLIIGINDEMRGDRIYLPAFRSWINEQRNKSNSTTISKVTQ